MMDMVHNTLLLATAAAAVAGDPPNSDTGFLPALQNLIVIGCMIFFFLKKIMMYIQGTCLYKVPLPLRQNMLVSFGKHNEP